MLQDYPDARVAIVEDNPANTALVEALLRRSGIANIACYDNARTALEAMPSEHFDLILLDLHMPDMDGFEMLDALSRHSKGRWLPVLVITADATEEAARRALALGAKDLITKPFDATQMLLRVRNLLHSSYLQNALRQANRELRQQVLSYKHDESSASALREVERVAIQKTISSGPTIVYQAVVDLKDGSLAGVEALSRFDSAWGSNPETVFDAAERVGLGVELELAAVAAALKDFSQLDEDVFMAVNVSPACLLSPHLPGVLEVADPNRIVLELTERVQIEDYNNAIRALRPLTSRGIRLAVDDLGSGYSSFRHILNLAPHIVKTDLHLTRGIDKDPARQALAQALLAFARHCSASVIAEGVETPSELDQLRRLGIPLAQGYHLGRPGPLRNLLTSIPKPPPYKRNSDLVTIPNTTTWPRYPLAGAPPTSTRYR